MTLQWSLSINFILLWVSLLRALYIWLKLVIHLYRNSTSYNIMVWNRHTVWQYLTYTHNLSNYVLFLCCYILVIENNGILRHKKRSKINIRIWFAILHCTTVTFSHTRLLIIKIFHTVLSSMNRNSLNPNLILLVSVSNCSPGLGHLPLCSLLCIWD